MKKIYLIVLFIGIYSFIKAQSPVITQSNYPNVGENYPGIVEFTAPWTPGGNGTDQTWDFSGLSNPSNVTFDYVAPSATPYSTEFSSSDISLNIAGQYSFFLTSPTEYQISGTVTNFGTAITRPYVDPQKVIEFPFMYLDEFKDTAQTSNYNTGGGEYQRRTIHSYTKADAYGALTIPGGTTYNNVLRLRITSKTIDSTFNSSDVFQTEDISIDTNYYWVSPSFKPHIFVLTKSVQDPAGSATTTVLAQYFTSPVAGTINTYNSYFSIYPNPVSTELFIETDENIFRSNPSLSVSLVNSKGVEVIQNPVTSNKTRIPRKDLPTGIYFYRISSNDKVLATGKLSID